MISDTTLLFATVFLLPFFHTLYINPPARAPPPTSTWDIEPMHPEAHLRWLRPAEICEILGNHGRFHVSSEHRNPPSGGSLFLFNRNIWRHFRRDGHKWGKKEAHEKLKVEGHQALNCYYARGEENRLLRRRVYWMLQQELSHMVLVHYREVEIWGISPYPDQTFSQQKESERLLNPLTNNDILEGNALTSSRPGSDNEIIVGWQDENMPYSQIDGASTDTSLFSSHALEHQYATETGSYQGQSSTTTKEISMDPIDDDLSYQIRENIGIQYWRSVYESMMTEQEHGLIDDSATSVFGGILEVGNHSGGSQGWQASNSDSSSTSNWTASQNLDDNLNLGQGHYEHLFGGETSSFDGVRLHNPHVPEPHTQLLQDDWGQQTINDRGSSVEQYSHGNHGSVMQESSWEEWTRGISACLGSGGGYELDFTTQVPLDSDGLGHFSSIDELFSNTDFGNNWAYSGYETDPTGIIFLTLACLGITLAQALSYYVF